MLRILDGREFNFTLIENELIDDIERFDKNDLLCYMVLCRFANNKSGECFPSYKTIAEKMRVGVSTAMKAIKSLADKGVIEITSRKNEAGGDTSNLYTIQSLKPNKKAPTAGTVEAQNLKKQIDNNIISQNTKKDSYKKKENKIVHNKFNDGTNNTFANYEADELEKLLKENQDRKFNPNYKI